MPNKILTLLLLLFSVAAFAQKPPRELLLGRVVSDSVAVEDVSVNNISSNIGAVTDRKGEFTIYARATDTLVFTGLVVHQAVMVVKQEHFGNARLLIKLDESVTMLDEVVVSTMTGNLEKDSKMQGRKITPVFDSGALVKADIQNNMREYKYSQEKNMLVDPVNREMQGLNFVGLYKAIFKPKTRKQQQTQYYYSTQRNFAEVVKERFSYHFFTETLKLNKDQIGPFLNFADKGNQTVHLLAANKEFELTDYLVKQSAEFLKTQK